MRKFWWIAGCLTFAFGCSSRPAGAQTPQRPPGADRGQVSGQVLLLSGTVSIQAANGLTFPAQPDMQVFLADELRVADGFAVIELVNHYLVRLDEDTSLPVREILLLDQPATGRTRAEQLEDLLSVEERRQPERIVGWHSRLTAAHSVAPVREERVQQRKAGKLEAAKMEEPAHEHKAMKDFGGRATADAPGAPPPKMAPPAPTVQVPAADQLDLKRTRGVDLGGASSTPQTKTVSPARSKPAPPPADRRDSLDEEVATGAPGGAPGGAAQEAADADEARAEVKGPELVQRLQANSGWVGCLAAHLKGLGLKLERVQVRLRVRAGKVVQLALGGALPVPACALEGVLHQSIGAEVEDGWVTFMLELR